MNIHSAACHIKLKLYDKAIEFCDEALEIAPQTAKALYRRGQAYHGKSEYKKAMDDLQKALSYAPHDKSIISELVAVRGEMQAYKSKEMQLYSKIFS